MAFRFREMRSRADEEEKKIFDDMVVAFEKAGIIEAIDVSMLDDDDLEMPWQQGRQPCRRHQDLSNDSFIRSHVP